MFSEIERTQQVIESEVIGDWQNVYLLAPSPDGTISNPSTKIARQCHSAEWRERIFFPLSFAFFALALLATVLFAEQVCWLAFLLALRAVCAARWLEGDEAFGYVGLGCPTRHVEIFFQAMLQMTWLRGMFGRQWVGRPGNAF